MNDNAAKASVVAVLSAVMIAGMWLNWPGAVFIMGLLIILVLAS